MINPASIMKMMQAKNQFDERHPKFSAFFNAMIAQGITADSVIEVTVQRPGEEPVTANMKVTKEDLDLVNELRSMSV